MYDIFLGFGSGLPSPDFAVWPGRPTIFPSTIIICDSGKPYSAKAIFSWRELYLRLFILLDTRAEKATCLPWRASILRSSGNSAPDISLSNPPYRAAKLSRIPLALLAPADFL